MYPGPLPGFGSRGPKTTRGGHMDLCSNLRAKHEMGRQILDEGRAPLPLPQARTCMYLVFLRCDAGQQGRFCSVVFIGSD